MAQRQLITFQLGEQVLGVDIMAIREIRAWSPSTPLPNVPSYVHGVVNLRGVALPVLDLRQLIDWGRTDPAARHVIIVVQVGNQLQGLIVDAVNDIVSIDPNSLQSAPDLSESRGRKIIEGIATADDRMVTILSLSSLLARTDLSAVA